jgi:hypothetical protein
MHVADVVQDEPIDAGFLVAVNQPGRLLERG